MYLFKPKAQAAEGPSVGSDGSGRDDAGVTALAPGLPSLQPGSVAEWAIGELLIRLGNRGRALRPEPPESATD